MTVYNVLQSLPSNYLKDLGDKLGTVRDTKNLYVYQMSLKRINCYHHSLWLSVNLVAKRIISYFRLIAFLLIFNPPHRNLRVKLETSMFNLVVPILYDNIRFSQETFFWQGFLQKRNTFEDNFVRKQFRSWTILGTNFVCNICDCQ